MAEYEKLIYTNSRGESLTFSHQSITHVNITRDVTGIADVANTLYTSSSMNQNGETFLGQKFDTRDVVITGNINTTDKSRKLDVRRAMQKVLNPELAGVLTYQYGDFIRVIDCRVSDAPVFKHKSVFTGFTIHLMCTSPFWREDAESKDDVASWIPCLEFELEIPEEDGIEFAYREPNVIVDVYNDGDVETDMRIIFSATGTLVNPMLLNVDTGEFIKINAELVAGDVVEINTKYGEKGATLTRAGETMNYFRYIDVDSTFMQLAIGDNVFRYSADAGDDQLEVSIYHSDKYLGV